MRDGVAHAPAEVAVAAVAELDRLEGAGGGAGGHDGTAPPARGEEDLDLDGRVAAGVEDLPPDDVLDLGHGVITQGSVVVRRSTRVAPVAHVGNVAHVTPVVAGLGAITAGPRHLRFRSVGIRVRSGAIDRIVASPDRFALQIEAPDDLAAAMAAARLARVDLVGLSGAEVSNRADISQVVAAPGGPLLLVQHLDASPEDLARVPTLLAERLADAGVGSATIAVPALGGRLDALDDTAGCVVLRLFPVPTAATTTIPADWLDVAVEWVIGDVDAETLVATRILSVEHEVAAHESAALLHECGVARAWCDLVNGDPADRVRSASLTYGRLPHLALAAGGPSVDGAGLLARFELLKDVARELAADVAYACLDIEATFEGLTLGLPVDGWRARGGASPNRVAATVVDRVVPDAFPWQVLGPGHLERLRSTPDSDELPTEALGDGRVEVAIGDAREWLPRAAARIDAQEDAIAWLSPLLVDEAELDALVATMPGAPSAAVEDAAASNSPFTVAASAAAPPAEAVPDLDAIVLQPTSTARRSTRLSPLELAAWYAHEAHTDHPASVSPVLATFVRWLAAGLDDETRQRLKGFVPRLVGTGPGPGDRGDSGDGDGRSAADDRRRWMAVEWLVKGHAAAWLRLAGLVEAADTLDGIGDLTDPAELARAVDILGSAITIAGRRIDITASIVAGEESADPDEPIAWDAWERVTEPTGWVAASEAATHGAPGDVAYSTDLRVIECSREPGARDALDATRSTLGGSAWTTAVHALADEAWDRAWRAADTTAREIAGVTIRMEMGRVAKGRALRRSSASEFPEVAIEEAEDAARDTLVRAALRGGVPDRHGEHPWDEACDAARNSPGGDAWSIVLDESRRAVGEAAWSHAMADARAVIDGLLDDARDVVAARRRHRRRPRGLLRRRPRRRLPGRRRRAGPRRRQRGVRARRRGSVAEDRRQPGGGSLPAPRPNVRWFWGPWPPTSPPVLTRGPFDLLRPPAEPVGRGAQGRLGVDPGFARRGDDGQQRRADVVRRRRLDGDVEGRRLAQHLRRVEERR